MGYKTFSTHDKNDHAFLAPSQAHIWLWKDKEYINNRYLSSQARFIGTQMHEQAERDIRYRLRRPKNKETFNMYVNDAIGFRMEPEVRIRYSDWCFGTADALSFRNEKLRIHDLKTGAVPAHMEQVLTYAALYCLEHDIRPSDIPIELRLYQSNDIQVLKPEAHEVAKAMDSIVTKTKWLEDISDEVR